ncbi:MAG: 16S rRNA (guanine(527)-N(7))-methyltransferase RsmG [Magnetococcales bacterium]|nr:16S rRNA (guanine(527)-N(7))-methyltransferase RsmG [Magnetococcales bacterium]
MVCNNEWQNCFDKLETIIKRPITSQEQEQLKSYIDHLLKWNKSYNLIGPSTIPSILDRHVIDSAPLLPLLQNNKIIADIGSGAGFPGLILAIFLKQPAQINLIESAGKKARFLQYIVNQLDLKDRCNVYNERAEKHSLNKNNEYYFVVSRAVGTLSLLAKLSYDLLQPGGFVLALKGERSEEEIKDFLASPYNELYEKPLFSEIKEIGGANIVSLKKVSRET